MKSLKTLGQALIVGILSLNFIACYNGEEFIPNLGNNTPNQGNYITVNLGAIGEILELKDSPLTTRVGKTDVYRIQVYTCSNNSSYDSPYAYGAFMSLNNVSIRLLEGEKYRFVTSILADAEISDMENDTTSTADDYIFELGDNIYSDFSYSSYERSLDYLSTDARKERICFYGELDKYSPTQNGVVQIPTKRTVYGAHFIAEGLTEGRLEIQINPYHYGYSVNLTPARPEYNGVYSFYNQREAWYGTYKTVDELVDYYTTKNLKVYWRKDNGDVIPLGSYDVTFKRNVKTTIRIKVEEPGSPSRITITRENASMVNDDNEYIIEGGKVTEIPIG